MRILIAEDDQNLQAMLRLILLQAGYEVAVADDGEQAWRAFQETPFPMVVTDWMMPNMDGLELCRKIRASPQPQSTHLIIVTSKDAKDELVEALDAGANDFIAKPYHLGELLARIRSGARTIELEQKISDQHQQLAVEQQRSEQLLHSLFPQAIVDRLKQQSGSIAEHFPEASVLFADIHDFSGITMDKSPAQVVDLLNQVFTGFDQLTEGLGLEKIRSHGDTYMAAAGVPVPRPDHAEAVAELALAMQQQIVQLDIGSAYPLQLRIGIDSGPVIAGVIGTAKRSYDLWGDTVIDAEQLKRHGLPGSIQTSAATYQRLHHLYMLDKRGEFFVEGKGAITTYLLTGRRESKGAPNQGQRAQS